MTEPSLYLFPWLLDSTDDLVWSVDLDHRLTFFNRAFGQACERSFGFKPAKGMRPQNLPPSARSEFWPPLVERALKEGPYRTEFLLADGRTLELALNPIVIDGLATGVSVIGKDVTGRKSAEEILRESLDSIQETQRIGEIGSYVLDIPSGSWTSSEVLNEVFGIGRDYDRSVAGWTVLIHPADQEMMAAYLAEEVVGKGLEFDKEYRIIRQTDQAERWVHGKGRLEFDGQDQPVKMRGVIRDITERKLAEMKLRDSESRYRIAFEMNLDAIDIWRREDGRFVDVNEAFTRCTGFTRDDVIGKTAAEIGIWEKKQDRQTMLDLLESDPVCQNLEVQFRTKDARLRWGVLSVAPIELYGVPCILSITRDITEVKAANERLAAAQEAMRSSRVRFSTAFQMNLDPAAISQLDDGMYIEVNAAFVNALGYTREEVVGKTSTELGIFAQPGNREKLAEALRLHSYCRDFEIQLRKKNGETFWGAMSATVIELDGVPHVFATVRDLSPALAAEDQIYKLAFFDPLTRLPNRRLFLDRLRQALVTSTRDDLKQALLLIDIDNFKALNDTLGYPAGDLLLEEAGRRIRNSVREADTVARIGGDEFAVMLSDLGRDPREVASHAKTVADKTLDALSEPYWLDGQECRCTASVGVTVFGGPSDSTNEILQQVDIALYQAKTAGRNNVHFFFPALQAAAIARTRMEQDLRAAIKEGQFLHCYQPQIEGNRVTGVEALIRWKHPTLGMVMPNDFIQVAEQTGLILPIGEWGLQTACAQLAAWARRKETESLTIAVNISAVQMRQPSFVGQVLAAIGNQGAKAELLRLELTESMLVENFDDTVAKMKALRAHGVRFSLDDFGTGFSSLSYLKRLPLDRLKIDRAFVGDILVDPASGAIARAIISLGGALEIPVIAEGVETEEQRFFLASLGCHKYQGYLFSRPLAIADLEVFLDEFNQMAGLQFR